MPKHEAGTPKAIANKIKSKGLQKLRWYCQMCSKQCRDQNGFKCHISSESHQRQLLLFGESPQSFLAEFSSEFEKTFMDIVRRQFGSKRVKANVVYQEYIKDKNHVHMNATSWHTLTGFILYLGRTGKCKIENTEKGWFLQYVDREEEERKEKVAKKQKMDKDDEERIRDLVEKQAERALEQAAKEDSTAAKEPQYTELKKNDDEKIEFSLGAKKPVQKADEKPSISADSVFKKPQSSKRKPEKSKDDPPSSKKPKSSLQEILETEERRKEFRNRKDYWLHKDIVVKVITKRLGDKYYKKKGVVSDLIDDYTANVKMIDGPKDILKLDQSHVETVIPALGKPVLIVNGAYRGLRAIMESLNEKNFSVNLKIDQGTAKDRIIKRIPYEDCSKLMIE